MRNTLIISAITLFFLWYIITYKRRKRKKALRKKILAQGLDYTQTAENIANSITNSKNLYKSLIKKVHPDLFTDERKIIAENISSRLTENKRNYEELSKIENEIKNFLNG